MQGKWIKPVIAVLAVPVVAIGAYQMVRAYEAGTTFQPSGSGRELQVNQVIFSGEEDTTAQKNDEEQNGESELWEKDKTAEDSLSPDLKNSADYLFQTGRANLPDNGNAETVNLAGDEPGNNTLLPADSTTGNGGFIYDITGDREHADGVIAAGGSIGGTGNGNDSGSGNGQGGNGINGSGTAKPADPTTAPDPEPTTRPADTVKDPESTKEDQRDFPFSFDYNEEVEVVDSVVYIKASDGARENGSYLYEGQTVTDRDLYNALDTYVVDLNTWIAYVWGADHYNKYVKIQGVSFDGGVTWISEYPVTIPTGLSAGQMVIRVAYRFHSTDPWTQTDVPFEPAASRVFALTEKLKKDSQVIDPTKIANKNQQYPEPGSILNLYQCQIEFFGNENTALNKLFPGWTENGQPVSWGYPVESGRHILEPMDMVELASEYVVKMKYESFSADYLGERDNHPLQTLTEYTPTYADTLEVPEYIQAVDPEDWISVGTMKLPDSVVYINTESMNLVVQSAYIVDAGNPRLYAGEDGILYNKAQTEILGIPCYTYEIDIPAKVESVIISAWGILNEIHLEAANATEIPEMNLENLSSFAKISMRDAILNDFADHYEMDLEGIFLQADGSDAIYTVQNHVVADVDGNLRYVLESAPKLLRLSENVERIGEQAFAKAVTEDVLINEDTEQLVLDRDCLKDSNVKAIWCHTEVQKQMLEEQLKQAGISDVEARIVSEQKVTTKQGYVYTLREPEGTAELLAAPMDLTYFDGTVTDDNGNEVAITAIGDSAFKNHTALKWVMLPENIKSMASEAFAGCTALEGVLIDSRDEFTIGNNAFSKCNAIRFIASNAPKVKTENNYAPVFTDELGDTVFYIPTNYSLDLDCFWYQNENARVTYFDSGAGVSEYSLESIGDSGKMLYAVGYNSVLWQFNVPFMAIRSGSKVDEQVTLPATTQEILGGAMRNTHSVSGSYTVNWDKLALLAIDDYAFADSDLAGEVTFGVNGKDSYLLKYAFKSCSNITDITVNGTIANLGEGCFVNCSGLVNVTLADFNVVKHWSGVLHSSIFAGCTSIKTLNLPGGLPDLTIPTRGVTFRMLGYETKIEDEYGILVIPEENRQACLEAWKYRVIGYSNDAELNEAAKTAVPSGDSEAIAKWKAEQIERGQRIIRNWLGIEKYTGDTEKPIISGTEETESGIAGQTTVTVSDGNAVPSVSDGNAMTTVSDGNTKTSDDSTIVTVSDGNAAGSTQEETK